MKKESQSSRFNHDKSKYLTDLEYADDLASVAHKVDNAIHLINHYTADKH